MTSKAVSKPKNDEVVLKKSDLRADLESKVNAYNDLIGKREELVKNRMELDNQLKSLDLELAQKKGGILALDAKFKEHFANGEAPESEKA